MDNYKLNNNEIIYPLFQVEIDDKKYLFYSYKKDNLTVEDVYVGEENNNDLLPVSDEMLQKLEEEYKNFFK